MKIIEIILTILAIPVVWALMIIFLSMGV